jgi:hypothetical protein
LVVAKVSPRTLQCSCQRWLCQPGCCCSPGCVGGQVAEPCPCAGHVPSWSTAHAPASGHMHILQWATLPWLSVFQRKTQLEHAYIMMNQPSPNIPVQPWRRPSGCPAIVENRATRNQRIPGIHQYVFPPPSKTTISRRWKSASCDTLALAQQTPQKHTQCSNELES